MREISYVVVLFTGRRRYEKRVREQRLRSEVALAKRETNAYLEQVQKAKVAKKIEERKLLKAQKEGAATKESRTAIREEKLGTKTNLEGSQLKQKKARADE